MGNNIEFIKKNYQFNLRDYQKPIFHAIEVMLHDAVVQGVLEVGHSYSFDVGRKKSVMINLTISSIPKQIVDVTVPDMFDSYSSDKAHNNA